MLTRKRKLSTKSQSKKNPKIVSEDDKVSCSANLSATEKFSHTTTLDCFIRNQIIRNSVEVPMPSSTLQLKLYNDGTSYFTVLSIEVKKTIATKNYGDGNGFISFRQTVDPFFILLNYCTITKLNRPTMYSLANEFGWTDDLQSFLSAAENQFLENGYLSLRVANLKLEERLDRLNCSHEVKDLIKYIFVDQ
eukprot:NODE_4_length_77007_cov_1.156642.p55 type:complete len:192 gc:universal NODE_4_length_77007_cov_1.156642:54317-53742(-)